jgi:transposase
MVEIFVANRLTSPHPLYRFDLWAEEFAAAELFGLDPAKLNDDRLGRTLDAVADAIDEIQMEIAERAVNVFGLSLEQAHLDITSFMFEGAHENGDPEFPLAKRGYNAQKDYKRKQVKTGQAVLKDGNVPIFHKTFDGNRTDSNTLMRVFEGLEFLRSKAKAKEMVHVGDSKLLSAGNLLFLLKQGVLFVGPGERGKQLTKALLELDPTAWTELDYASESELLKRKNAKPEDWNRYWGQEFPASVTDPETGKKFEYRKLFIRSSDEIRATLKNRERQMQKAEEELQKVANGIPRYYKTKDEVDKKVDGILESRQVKEFFKVEVGIQEEGGPVPSVPAQTAAPEAHTANLQTNNDEPLEPAGEERLQAPVVAGKVKVRNKQATRPNRSPAEVAMTPPRPYLKWSRDAEAIGKAEKVSGCYPLLSNLLATRSANEILSIQKDEYRVEHRFADWKGPLEVCPIFLHSNRRIAALLLVTALALMVFSLIERQVRKAMGDKDGYAVGFLPERRKSRPTGKTILYALRVVTAIIVRGEPQIIRILNISPMVKKIHDVFGVTTDQVLSRPP